MRRVAPLAICGFLAGVATASAGGRPPPPDLQPVPDSVRVLPIADPDPDGGAPWGLRIYSTRDGGSCDQVGRVLDGKLGTVDDQGRFEEAPVRPNGCGGAGPPGTPPRSYGWSTATTNVGAGGCAEFPSRRDHRPRCTDRQLRTVQYGHFGPALKRVLVANADWSGRRDVQVSDQGDYVAVFRGVYSDATQPRIRLYFDGGCGPDRERLIEEWYRATVRDCQVVVPLDEPRPVRESAASKRARRNPSKPMRVTVTPHAGHIHRRFTVRYKVPITVGPSDGYTYDLTGPTGRGCVGGKARSPNGSWFKNYRDMVRGRTDEFLLSPGRKADWCRGTYRVSVRFVSRGKRYAPFGSASFVVR